MRCRSALRSTTTGKSPSEATRSGRNIIASKPEMQPRAQRMRAMREPGRTGANRVYDTLGREIDALSTEFQSDAIEGRFTAQIDETLWLDIRNRRISDGGVVSVQLDTSEQVARQERLSNEQSILQSAIAAMPSGISV